MKNFVLAYLVFATVLSFNPGCPCEAELSSALKSAVALHDKALAAEKNTNVRGALELEKQATLLAPANALYHAQLALYMWDVGFFSSACEQMRIALKLSPENCKYRFNFAVMLQSTADATASVKEYEKVIAADPRNLQAKLGLVQALALAGRSLDAVKNLDQLRVLGRNDPELMIAAADTAIEIQLPKRAIEILKKITFPPTDPRVNQLLYLAASKDGDLKTASSIERKVIESKPTDSEIYQYVARGQSFSQKVSDAKWLLEKAHQAVPHNGDLFLQLGGVYIRRAIQMKAENNRAEFSLWIGLADGALQYAIEARRSEWKYIFAQAGVCELAGKRRESISLMDEIVNKYPKNELVIYCRNRLKNYSVNVAAAARRNFKSIIGVSPAAPDEGANEPIVVACARAEFKKLGCGCHTAVMEVKWRRIPGVLYARLVTDHPPVAVIVHHPSGDSGEYYKSRIISASETLGEHVLSVKDEIVRGLPALSMQVCMPEVKEEPPLLNRLCAPALQKL